MENAAARRARCRASAGMAMRNGVSAQFLISGRCLVAAVRGHLKRGEAPPPIVDRMVRTTYSAIVADYHVRQGAADVT